MKAMTKEERVQQLSALLDQARVIPAVRMPEALPAALASPSAIIYFLCGNLENIPVMVEQVLRRNKAPIVNLDLVDGFARDAAAISYLASRCVQGILSVHQEPLQAARSLGMFAIKRSFLIDSGALKNTLRAMKQFLPDALEIMPAAVSPMFVPNVRESHPEIPLIAGGLVRSMREVETLVGQGIRAVSASDHSLWIV